MSATKENLDEAFPEKECPEKWEIEAVGEFLSQLYFQQMLSQRNNWNIDKQMLHAEFYKFITNEENSEFCSKFHELFDDSDIERLLYCTKYLINSPCELNDDDCESDIDSSNDSFTDSKSTDDDGSFIIDSDDSSAVELSEFRTCDSINDYAFDSDTNDTDDSTESDINTGDSKDSGFYNGFYCINSSLLFEYWSKNIEKFDEQRKNKKSTSTIKISAPITDSEENKNILWGLVDPDLYKNSISYPVEYKKSIIRKCRENFFPTNIGCYICQTNFRSTDKFEAHVELHGSKSSFKMLNAMKKSSNPIFKLSYKLSEESHYFCFAMESKLPEIVIEKIIIVQSRSLHYADKERLPYDADGKNMFFVDSHLFTKNLEQPIIIVCRDKNYKDGEIIEQHHFMRTENFPEVNFPVHPYRLPDNHNPGKKWKLPLCLPPIRLCRAANENFSVRQLGFFSREFKEYYDNGKTFTSNNITFAMKTMLQVEDICTLLEYGPLIQRNVQFYEFEPRGYSFQMEVPDGIAISDYITCYDQVLIIPKIYSTIYLQRASNIQLLLLKYHPRVFHGIIRNISDGRIKIYSFTRLRMNQSFIVIFRPSRIIIRSQYRALENIRNLPDKLRTQFFFPECSKLKRNLSNINLNLVNETIYGNPEQLQAVKNIVDSAQMHAPYIIFGPPGTGKTTTIVEAILQLYLTRPDTKIFVTVGSNAACDEIAKRLCSVISKLKNHKRSIVRIYARSYEYRMENIDDLVLEYSNLYSTHFLPDTRTIHEYRIVICTMSIVGRLSLLRFGVDPNGNGIFTHIFMDEGAASNEIEAMVALSTTISSKANLILSGDHKQLGPVVKSSRAEGLGLGVSLMERLLKRDCYAVDEHGNYDSSIQTRLCRNYRSHPEIVGLYNSLYYNNELKPKASEDVTSMCDKWHRSLNETYPIIFHCVYGTAEVEGPTYSWFNQQEIDVVLNYVKDLMYFGVNGQKITQEDIGIISPYKSQYKIINEELELRDWHNIATGAVESFQGKEKTVIIASFVRSYTRTLGFLQNPKRLNVTLSRPKSFLILVGNPTTLSSNSDFKYIINECRRHNTLVDGDYYDPAEEVSAAMRETAISSNSVFKKTINKPLVDEDYYDVSEEISAAMRETAISSNSVFRKTIYKPLVDEDYYDVSEEISAAMHETVVHGKMISLEEGNKEPELKSSTETTESMKTKIAEITSKLSTLKTQSSDNAMLSELKTSSSLPENISTVMDLNIKSNATIPDINNQIQCAETTSSPSDELNIDLPQEDSNNDVPQQEALSKQKLLCMPS